MTYAAAPAPQAAPTSGATSTSTAATDMTSIGTATANDRGVREGDEGAGRAAEQVERCGQRAGEQAQQPAAVAARVQVARPQVGRRGEREQEPEEGQHDREADHDRRRPGRRRGATSLR